MQKRRSHAAPIMTDRVAGTKNIRGSKLGTKIKEKIITEKDIIIIKLKRLLRKHKRKYCLDCSCLDVNNFRKKIIVKLS